jgi:arsenate reductase (glutaredoxin)
VKSHIKPFKLIKSYYTELLLGTYHLTIKIMPVTLYHNPKCSKSRQTLELLGEKNITPTIIEYLKNPPTAEKLQEILSQLGVAPRDLMRKKEDAYKELGLGNPALSDEDLIGFMVKHPILIERPIVVANGKAALGRPPEQVLDIL